MVDSESPTGAPGLYERAGMKVARHYAVYRKELRPEAPSAEVAASNPAAGEPPSEDSPPQ